jgi:hypothetical protein
VTIFVPTEPRVVWELLVGIRDDARAGTDYPSPMWAFKVPPERFIAIELLKSKYKLDRSCITLDQLKSLSRQGLSPLARIQ